MTTCAQPYLEKYRGRNSRHECPACHDKHSLTLYISAETGQPIDSSVGRCDHESGCGYHYTPKQYFADHPALRESPQRDRMGVKNFTPSQSKGVFSAPLDLTATHSAVPTGPQPEPGRIPRQYIIDSLGYRSDFVRFLCSIFNPDNIESPTVQRLMSEYYLGQTKDGAVIFWQIDAQKRIRTGKIMRYNPLTGKRIKEQSGAIDWVHARLKRERKLPDDYNLAQCLFGEHLLRRHPEKPVALVESEKSAIIAGGVWPDFVWLATGGKSQLSIDKLKILAGRTVIMFPDADGYNLWREKATEIERVVGCTVTVSDLLERSASPQDKANKIDLADWLVRELRGPAPAQFCVDGENNGITARRSDIIAPPSDAYQRDTPPPDTSNMRPPGQWTEGQTLAYLAAINPNVLTMIDRLGIDGGKGRDKLTMPCRQYKPY